MPTWTCEEAITYKHNTFHTGIPFVPEEHPLYPLFSIPPSPYVKLDHFHQHINNKDLYLSTPSIFRNLFPSHYSTILLISCNRGKQNNTNNGTAPAHLKLDSPTQAYHPFLDCTCTFRVLYSRERQHSSFISLFSL